MSRLEEILSRLTGNSRSQDLAYTKDENSVNKWHDEKIERAKAEIIEAVMECLPHEKAKGYWEALNCKLGANDGINWSDDKVEGFNQALDEVHNAVEGL